MKHVREPQLTSTIRRFKLSLVRWVRTVRRVRVPVHYRWMLYLTRHYQTIGGGPTVEDELRPKRQASFDIENMAGKQFIKVLDTAWPGSPRVCLLPHILIQTVAGCQQHCDLQYPGILFISQHLPLKVMIILDSHLLNTCEPSEANHMEVIQEYGDSSPQFPSGDNDRRWTDKYKNDVAMLSKCCDRP